MLTLATPLYHCCAVVTPPFVETWEDFGNTDTVLGFSILLVILLIIIFLALPRRHIAGLPSNSPSFTVNTFLRLSISRSGQYIAGFSAFHCRCSSIQNPAPALSPKKLTNWVVCQEVFGFDIDAQRMRKKSSERKRQERNFTTFTRVAVY